MNNEELKKKIVDTMHPILNGTRVSCNEDNACEHCIFPCEVDRIADRLADALIAAGIGDMETVQNISASATAIAVLEAAQAKHRAEVAEMALKIADELGELCGRKEDYVQQAEKELAEEGNDDGRGNDEGE